jgi:hypothetical protein
MATTPLAVQSEGSKDPAEEPDPEVPERPRQRRYPAAYKMRILTEYETLDRAEKGALLRREGLYTSLPVLGRQLSTWLIANALTMAIRAGGRRHRVG